MALPPPAAGSTALVTGASSGIGADMARSLARRGHGVTLVARRTDRLEELAAELREKHDVRAETLGADLGDSGSRTRMLAQFAELGLEVEILVNNAGFGTAGPFHTLDPERETEMVRLNCEAVVALCGRFAPAMAERGRGAILNVASTAAFQPLPRQATYTASKAFVLTFTEALHADLRPSGIAVTALCPGPVKTEFGEVAGVGALEESAPSFIFESSEDVAEAGIKGLEKNRRVVVPGLLNRATAAGGQHAPRGVLLRAAQRLYPMGK
jgi:short-subunit dehydrogenase